MTVIYTDQSGQTRVIENAPFDSSKEANYFLRTVCKAVLVIVSGAV